MGSYNRFNRRVLLGGVSMAALATALPSQAEAQENPGLYGILEGRYLFTNGESTDFSNSSGPSSLSSLALKPGGDGFGAKATLGYRFDDSPWDLSVGAAGNWLDGIDRSSHLYFSYNSRTFLDGMAHASTNYYVVDFTAGYNMRLGNTEGDLRFFGGVRYADFTMNYSASSRLSAGPGYFSYDNFARRSKFFGVGPVIGGRGSTPLGDSGLSVFGSLSGSAIFGKLTRSDTEHFALQSNSTPISDMTTRTDKQDRTAFNLEAELGLSYPLARLANVGNVGFSGTLETGMRMEQWWNVNDTTIGSNGGGTKHAGLQNWGPFVRVKLPF